MAGTIQGTFGWDNSPLIAGMRESEKIVNRGASNIQSKITGLFKRDPSQRAERAIGGFIQSLAGGDVTGGIQSLTGSMSAFGLAAGVAIGAGVALFAKFKEQINATREAHAALETEMTRRPLSIVSKLSDEGMAQALQTREKLFEDARKKSEKTFGSELAEAAKSTMPFFFGKSEGKERIAQQKLENKEGAEAKQIMLDRAKLALSLTEIERNRLQGNEREANISKIILEAEQKRNALALSGVSRAAFGKGDEAISRNAEMQVALENKRADAKERSLAVEEKMAELIKKGLTGEDQRKVRAGLELKSIDEQLAGETSPQARRELLLKKAQKENELRGMRPPGEENPFKWGTLSAGEWESQRNSAKFNEGFASFGLTQDQKDRKGPQAQNAEVVKEVEKTNQLLEKIFLRP